MVQLRPVNDYLDTADVVKKAAEETSKKEAVAKEGTQWHVPNPCYHQWTFSVMLCRSP